MSFFERMFSWSPPWAPLYTASAAPRAAVPDAGIVIRTPQELEEALRSGQVTASGTTVTATTALRNATVFACVRLITGAVANLPLDIKRRVDDRTRLDATDTALWRTLRRKPNRWQKPAQFKRMMQAHVLLRGNAYAVKTWNARAEVMQLVPLHPDRVEPRQRDDQAMEYIWTRKDGSRILFQQEDILHLFGLSLDGITGVSTIGYARETIGAAMAMGRHGAAVFGNGANVSSALKSPKALSPETYERLKTDMDEFRAGGSREGKTIILEDGLEFERMALTAEDAQWVEAMGFSRVEICMFFGVPPHLVGHTDGNTRLGSSIEQQGQGFVTYTLEDYLTMWEEGVSADCINEVRHPDLYARFNRSALVKGDIKTRWAAHVQALQWGVRSPNEVRALEDENPREGGDIYYPPPNTAGGEQQEDRNEPSDAA